MNTSTLAAKGKAYLVYINAHKKRGTLKKCKPNVIEKFKLTGIHVVEKKQEKGPHTFPFTNDAHKVNLVI